MKTKARPKKPIAELNDNSNTLLRHLDIMRNERRRKQSKLPASLYDAANAVLNSGKWGGMTSIEVVREMKRLGVRLQDLKGPKGRYVVPKVAAAVIQLNGPVRTREVVGSATAFGQALMNSGRDNDVEAAKVRHPVKDCPDVRRKELWGNTPSEDIRAKMTGGRSANERQVGGSHYNNPIQHWDYVTSNGIPYMEAQIIKYVSRWRLKNGLEDLLKAEHFLQKLIELNTAK